MLKEGSVSLTQV
ncbi:MAG: hypothetical protein H0W28_00275 [Pyrinomonadaceae bacterium]|nr:hypothetical protein [Pyrinomonadaceae bacterium]